jgi:plastocyanin
MSLTRGAGSRVVAPALLIAALVVAGCGGAVGPSPSPSPGPSSPASTEPSAASTEPSPPASAALACASGSESPAATVTIKNFAYAPTPVTVKAGQAVTFQNEDGVPHTATMLDGACDTGTISGGGSATLVFSAPGTYRYHCRIHPRMPTATIVVEG